MADDDNTGILILGGVGLYLFATGKLSGLFGQKGGNGPASGVAPKPSGGPGLGAAACIAAGAYAGGPTGASAGAALGSLCDKLPGLIVNGGVKVATTLADGVNWASNHGTPIYRSLNPFAGGTVMTGAQVTKWKADDAAKGGTPPAACGGWKGACPTEAPTPPAPAPPQFMGPTFKPMGFR